MNNFQKKKKKTFQAKKQAGAKKEGFFGPKIGKKLKCKGKKLSNFPKKEKKKDFLGQKETSWDWAWKEKKEFLGTKNWENFA